MSEPVLQPIGLIDRAALEFLRSKQLLPGYSHYDVWLYQHAVSFTVAKMMDADMLAETRDAVASAIANGTGFAEFKQRLKPYLMSRGWWGEQIMTDPADGVPKLVQLGSTRRLRVIFQTNMATAYAAGQWSRIQQNKRALPYLRYNPSAAGNPRDSHRPYYGLILPVDHPLWQQIFPPNGYGCLCSVSQLTRRQAERAGISAEPDIEMVEFTNPRTGQTITLPKDITPGFAHNHGDRLGAMNALFGERHSPDALAQMIAEREQWLSERMQPPPTANLVPLPKVVLQAAVARLMQKKGPGDLRKHEAEAAAQWEFAYQVKLVPYDLPVEKDQKPPDYLIEDPDKAKEDWLRIDFMFTEDEEDLYSVNNLNRFFMHTDDAWEGKKVNIQKHLDKADIVPLDLRHLTAINRAKLLAYVLSLPPEQRDRIYLIVKESP